MDTAIDYCKRVGPLVLKEEEPIEELDWDEED